MSQDTSEARRELALARHLAEEYGHYEAACIHAYYAALAPAVVDDGPVFSGDV